MRISAIHAFGWERPDSQLLYMHHNVVWEDLPKSIQNYLAKAKSQLESRKTFQSSTYLWFNLHRPREGMRERQAYTLFSPKIFFPRRSAKINLL
ncbi:MAG: hypothetical protein R2865_07405 [Deinococcales bacterium]